MKASTNYDVRNVSSHENAGAVEWKKLFVIILYCMIKETKS